MLFILKSMVGEFTTLDKDEWREIPDRHVHRSGNVFAGKGYMDGYEVRLFVRKIKE